MRDGDLSRRPEVTRAVPSIARADLDRLRPLLENERRLEQQRADARERDQATRLATRAAAARDAPPDAEHEWWTVAHAAAAFGVGANRVRQLVDQGRLPVTRRQGRVWLRRDHVLQAASALAFRAAQTRARGKNAPVSRSDPNAR